MSAWLAGFAAAAALALGLGAPAGWTAEEQATLRSLWIATLGPPPPDPSNRVADVPAAAALGQALFSDARLSADGRVSCASCHRPDHGFTDALPVGHGVGDGNRRTMPVAQAVHSPWQFWDGRADSLWAQALGPTENPVEHGFTRVQVVRVLAAHYGKPYRALFGPLPDPARLPPRASPAGPPEALAAWDRMTPADQDAVNRAYANFGKAIAAYERTLRVRPSRFDAYLAGLFGEPAAGGSLTDEEVAGLKLFIGKARCSTCHNGPLLTNHGFANTGVPARPGLAEDLGRAVGVSKALADPFNCKGRYSDAGPGACDELEYAVAGDAAQTRAYKVPSLRGVAARAPYMHAGQYATLEQVVDHYDRAPAPPSGKSELQPLHLTAQERRDLVAFLRTLDDAPARGVH